VAEKDRKEKPDSDVPVAARAAGGVHLVVKVPPKVQAQAVRMVSRMGRSAYLAIIGGKKPIAETASAVGHSAPLLVKAHSGSAAGSRVIADLRPRSPGGFARADKAPDTDHDHIVQWQLAIA
jgi:hypothetical protein